VRELGLASGRGVKVSHGSDSIDSVDVEGGTSNFAIINNYQVANGRFITDIDVRHRLPVAFLGNDLRERFFPNLDPIGKTINIEGRPFEVIGTAKAKGSVFGQSMDNFAVIPIETYFKIYGSRSGMAYIALAQNRLVLNQAQDEIR